MHGAPLTTTALTLEDLLATISNGREQMPAFGRALRPDELLHDVAAYIVAELKEWITRAGQAQKLHTAAQ